MKDNVTDFYDELDLKYPEIAICMEDIDRIHPMYKKFIIPVLTPNLDISSLIEAPVPQSANNLQNGSNMPQVSSLVMKNYVKLKIPKELCGFVGGAFTMLPRVEYSDPDYDLWPRVETKSPKPAHILIKDAHQIGNGSVRCGGVCCGGGNSINVRGTVDGVPTDLLHLMPVDRIIHKPSKWIVVFIGGDITKPRIIGRYYEDGEN